MINRKKAIRRIKRDLKKILKAAPLLKHPKGAGRIFELYIMIRVAKRLQDIGWTVEPIASNGTKLIATDKFTLRGGAPTGIKPTTATTGPSSIKISKGGKDYEIWNGVQFQGRSGALHELDLSVVPHGLAVILRGGSSEGFPLGRPMVAIECKDVVAAGSPDEMRSVVARMYDLTILHGHLKYLALPNGFIFDSPTPTFHEPPAPKTYLESNTASFCALARRGGLSSGAGKMTGLFCIRPFINVSHPSMNANVLVDHIAKWIDSHL